ncbi:sugar-binding transcriptional regulator [Xylanimonas allomyrinae]|uniref:Sugar-binding transcriptional regulator n=1 Tax=Xylanimonas allomyrinae TaxID=2509459 RepID=A0A4P6ENE8_9MICO|nr:sugar-binding transcriptional regulator [Xylanimonas allomyrinae]QAY64390.1 sugar-binding transcriptional regulator [Xylanimonas allomyrinae]
MRQCERDDIEVQLHVARLYFSEHQTQAEIARTIGYSRATVSRLLTRAKRAGIVRVTITHPLEHVLEIEQRLKEGLALTLVRVAETRGPCTIDALGRTAADLLTEVAADGQVIGVGNGRAVAATARSLPAVPRPHTTVVQLLGSPREPGSARDRDSPALCHQIARRLSATCARAPFPLFADDAQTALQLRREQSVATTMALAARADVAIVGVGGVTAGHPELAGHRTPEVAAAITRGKAVGHILDHHYDAQGRHIVTPLCARMLALTPEELGRIPLVIGVANGAHKVDAILGAARGNLLRGLVTDEATAELILGRLRSGAPHNGEPYPGEPYDGTAYNGSPHNGVPRPGRDPRAGVQ